MKKTQCDQAGLAGAVGDPAGGEGFRLAVVLEDDDVFPCSIQFEGFDGGGADDGAALIFRHFQQVEVELRAVELESRKPRLGVRPDFGAGIRAVVFGGGEPHPQAVLLEMLAGKVVGEPEYPGQEATGDLRRRFADLAVENLRFLNDEHPGFRPRALQEQAKRGPGESPAENDDIVVGGGG